MFNQILLTHLSREFRFLIRDSKPLYRPNSLAPQGFSPILGATVLRIAQGAARRCAPETTAPGTVSDRSDQRPVANTNKRGGLDRVQSGRLRKNGIPQLAPSLSSLPVGREGRFSPSRAQ